MTVEMQEMGSSRESEMGKTDLEILQEELKIAANESAFGMVCDPANGKQVEDSSGAVISEIDGESAVVINSFGSPNQSLSHAVLHTQTQAASFDPTVASDDVLQNASSKEKDEKRIGDDGDALKGRKVHKRFGRKLYSGVVISYDPETHWYKVAYEDGDEEDLEWFELKPILIPTGGSSASKKRSRSEPGFKWSGKKGKKDAQEEENEEVTVAKRPRRSATKRRWNNSMQSSSSDSMSSDSMRGVNSESDEPPVESRSNKLTEEEPQEQNLGLNLLGTKTLKEFGGTMFSGKIIGYDDQAKYYKVQYEDGDEEELDWSELKPTLLGEEKNHSSISSGITPRRGRPRLNKNAARGKDTSSVHVISSPSSQPAALQIAKFSSASDGEGLGFHAWGEVVSHDKAKCPELQAVHMFPSSTTKITFLAASHHHLAAITNAGQVWVWRNKHDNLKTRCNHWEHISDLDSKAIVFIDIAGPNVNRYTAGYAPNQEDQVPDPFYLAAISKDGKDYLLQGSQPHEPVRTYKLSEEPRHLGLRSTLELMDGSDDDGGVKNGRDDVGRVVQISLGTVEALDEPPFAGYITDTHLVYIRSATKDFMEEVNNVTGFTGNPVKIQCGSSYFAIIMTDDGHAWTWGHGHTDFSTCQPALGSLVGRKVVDVGCYYGEFVALTDDGDVHVWSHGHPYPEAGLFDIPTLSRMAAVAAGDDKLKKVRIGAGMCAAISGTGKVITWLIPGSSVPAGCWTPLGRDDEGGEPVAAPITALGTKDACNVVCAAGSLIVAVQKRPRGRPGRKKKESQGSE